MPTHKADKSKGEEHSIPEGEEVVSQRTVGGVEYLETEVVEGEEHECDECDASFDSHQALAGHMNKHE